MISFAVESFAQWRIEASELFAAHFTECANFQDSVCLNQDFDLAYRLDHDGRLVSMTARLEDGQLVGYALFVIGQMPHYHDVLMADCDLFYIAPAHRSPRVGLRFLQFTRDALAMLSVQRIKYRCKVAADWSGLLEMIGCVETERVWEIMPTAAGER